MPIFLVDRTKPLEHWKPGLAGVTVREKSPRSAELVRVELASLRNKTYFREGEDSLLWSQFFERAEKAGDIPLDAQFGLQLFQEKNRKSLEWIRKNLGITKISCSATEFVIQEDERSSIILEFQDWRDLENRWHLNYSWWPGGDNQRDTEPITVVASG